MADVNKIYLSHGPHLSSKRNIQSTMLFVIIALLLPCISGVVIFGIPALVTLLVSVASSVIFEMLFQKLTKQTVRIKDLSAVVTGIMLALTLPPAIPIWMTMLGSLFAIVVAKGFFGGIGANVFNPALAGRAFLFTSFPTAMSTWTLPFDTETGATILGAMKQLDSSSGATILNSMGGADAASGATSGASVLHSMGGADAASGATSGASVLHSMGEMDAAAGATILPNLGSDQPVTLLEVFLDYLIGTRAGCIGETSILLIGFSSLFLLLTKIIDWRAPVAMVVVAVTCSTIAGTPPGLALMSGGLVFGAAFMSTDYATTPVTKTGRLIFGAGAGLITFLIRQFGGYPEGVMFSILIMNALTPFLDKIIPVKYKIIPMKYGHTGKGVATK